MQNYEPGDELFFFGFSRGAFTARSTVGLVRNAGILRRENIGLINKAYALYRSRTDTKTPRGREATLFRRSYSYEPRIRFIGVWDTVGALGIPAGHSGLIARFNSRWAFHNTDLSTYVDSAYQALAIDEQRGPFEPSIWNVQSTAGNQEVEQVWFAGAHSDVGGGYDDHGLSDIPLLWMVDRATRAGLAFQEGAFVHERTPPPGTDTEDAVHACTRVMPDPCAELHQSRKGVYRLMRPFVRKADFSDGSCQKVSATAVQRRLKDPSYAPEKFLWYLDDVRGDITGEV